MTCVANAKELITSKSDADLMATKYVARPSSPPWSSAHTALLTDDAVHAATIESILDGSAAVMAAEGSSLPPPGRAAQPSAPPVVVRPTVSVDVLTAPDPLRPGMF